MTSPSSGRPRPKKPTVKGLGSVRPLDPRLLDLDQKCFVSPITGQAVRVDKATDEEFDQFIRSYITIGWTLEDRLEALVEAIRGGSEPKFCKEGATAVHPNFSEA
jgi:hypothetical protein